MRSKAPPTIRKGRLGSKKSTNGCVTCKIRRVKCDEQRPSCQRCRSTGRRCDGYPGSTSSSGAPASLQVHSISRPDQYVNVEQTELRSFEFFIRRVVPGFTRIVEAHFWHQIIPQLSRAEPLMWNAVVAMSCLIQHPQYSTAPGLPGGAKTPVIDEHHRKALTWYSKSIAGLKERLAIEKTPSSLALVACVLYMCIECLQDNMIEAATLHRSAAGMLGLVATEGGRRLITPYGTRLEDTIRALVRHEATAHGLLDLHVSRPKVMLDSVTGRFNSLSDAREELYAVITETQAFIFRARKIKEMQGKDWKAPPDFTTQQEHLLTSLLRWHLGLTNTTGGPSPVSSPDEDELTSVLLVSHGQYSIWLSVCLSTSETAFDQFNHHFESIVDHAHRAITATKTNLRPAFMFETRVIPSLYFVATKCRHPQIRRRALFLLRNGPKVENLWKAEPMADVAQKVIGIEESGSELGIYEQDPLRSDLPPESHRLYRQEVVELKGDNGQLGYYLVLNRWHQDAALQWSRTEHVVKL
ncbi:hypothetical protein RBB50_006897 [Rhinocladiella similis]